MRWGCCGDLERFEAIESAGYDFIESPVRVLCVDEPPKSAESYRSAVLGSRLNAEAFNVFLPGTLPIIGPDVDSSALNTHVQTIVDRVSDLGAEIIVLGSGGARGIPEGWDPHEGRKQFLAFCNLAADITGPAGITIVIEPLVKRACNYIHTIAEGRDLADAVGRSKVSTLADLYHMQMNEDPIEVLGEYAPHLMHVHVPVPRVPGRVEHDLDFDHSTFLAQLKHAGYKGRISVEDNGKNFADFDQEAGPVLTHLKKLWETV
ncbi:MAG: hypothetical protein CME19_07745 [Gemmatimonadetes bacterium]|nr:hypothetical protein [Gemmatimonadota bacterium]|tara:strand:+ start:3135 stop:3920 length:786 start_codon:yes stop_codon:yes gene_type:complete